MLTGNPHRVGSFNHFGGDDSGNDHAALEELPAVHEVTCGGPPEEYTVLIRTHNTLSSHPTLSLSILSWSAVSPAYLPLVRRVIRWTNEAQRIWFLSRYRQAAAFFYDNTTCVSGLNTLLDKADTQTDHACTSRESLSQSMAHCELSNI